MAGKRKMTDEQVVEIRERHAAGETQKALADEFGLAQPVLGYLVRGITYSDVGGPLLKARPRRTRAEMEAARGPLNVRESISGEFR